jgi:hypothetical protein
MQPLAHLGLAACLISLAAWTALLALIAVGSSSLKPAPGRVNALASDAGDSVEESPDRPDL